MPSPISTKELLERLQGTGFDMPVLPKEDPRWQRLRLEPGQGVDLHDRFRGALMGGAIGDAMGRPNEGVWPSAARERRIRDYQPWRGWRRESSGRPTSLEPGGCREPGRALSICGTKEAVRAIVYPQSDQGEMRAGENEWLSAPLPSGVAWWNFF